MYYYSEDWKNSEIFDIFDDFVYRKDYDCPDGIVITHYEGDETHLIIPDKLDGKPVIGIGREAFCNVNLKYVYIPDGVWRMKYDVLR